MTGPRPNLCLERLGIFEDVVDARVFKAILVALGRAKDEVVFASEDHGDSFVSCGWGAGGRGGQDFEDAEGLFGLFDVGDDGGVVAWFFEEAGGR